MFPGAARDNRPPGHKHRARPPARGSGSAELALQRGIRWYLRAALEARRNVCALTLAGLVTLAGCGGAERQDEDEPEGNFAVEVVRASFPDDQKLAKSSNLVITVRNAGRETIPNIAVTVDGFDIRKDDPELADPERPQFVINGRSRDIGGFPEAKEAAPLGCDTAYVNTWACGPLRAGREKTFRWSVTAVQAGDFDIKWRVAAGLDGKAKAVGVGSREAPRGSFTGTVSDEAPDVRVADDGKTVVEGTR
jgi:hypothetical protein